MWWVLSQYPSSFLLYPRYIPRGPHLHQLWEVSRALKIRPVGTEGTGCLECGSWTQQNENMEHLDPCELWINSKYFFFSISMWKQNNYLFIWNSNLNGHPLFYLATLEPSFISTAFIHIMESHWPRNPHHFLCTYPCSGVFHIWWSLNPPNDKKAWLLCGPGRVAQALDSSFSPSVNWGW